VELGLHDYFDIIKRPMYLGIIQKKIESGGYHAIEDFSADVRLTFDNAMLYNEANLVVHDKAKELKVKFFYQRLWGTSCIFGSRRDRMTRHAPSVDVNSVFTSSIRNSLCLCVFVLLNLLRRQKNAANESEHIHEAAIANKRAGGFCMSQSDGHASRYYAEAFEKKRYCFLAS